MVALNIRPPAHERNAPPPPGKRERMWNAIRQLRIVDPQKLALCTESSAEDARRFMALLRRAGYMVRADQRKSRLVRNTGPKPPMIMWDDTVAEGLLDRNTGVAYGLDNAPAPVVTEAIRRAAGTLKLRLKPRRRRGRKAVAQ